MASFNKFNCFVADVANKVHNLGSDTLKIMLTNSAPSASNTIAANITEISAGNGYTAGGLTLTVTASSQTGGVYKLLGHDPSITASCAVVPFQYSGPFNYTPTSPVHPLIGDLHLGSS